MIDLNEEKQELNLYQSCLCLYFKSNLRLIETFFNISTFKWFEIKKKQQLTSLVQFKHKPQLFNLIHQLKNQIKKQRKTNVYIKKTWREH